MVRRMCMTCCEMTWLRCLASSYGIVASRGYLLSASAPASDEVFVILQANERKKDCKSRSDPTVVRSRSRFSGAQDDAGSPVYLL